MADQNSDRPPLPPARESELVPAMMAIALAFVAQLAVSDGLTLLGVAGYIVAAWLFVSSVRGIFDSAPGQPAGASQPAAAEPETAGVAPSQSVDGPGKMRYLRQNWRLVTIAEIFRGDIPPARLGGAAAGVPLQAFASDESREDDAPAEADPAAPVAGAASVKSWLASDSADSAPKSVKVTDQGDVLVLDAGLEQVQRFDEAGKLQASYSLAGLAGLEILDLAVSADGHTLYIVDAASKRLQVITLTDDETAGEEE